jgi:hypothetical protein
MRAACCRNAPSVWHKRRTIELDWCYRPFEIDSNIRVFSAWTLQRYSVSVGPSSGYRTTHACRTACCTVRSAKRIAHFFRTFFEPDCNKMIEVRSTDRLLFDSLCFSRFVSADLCIGNSHRAEHFVTTLKLSGLTRPDILKGRPILTQSLNYKPLRSSP